MEITAKDLRIQPGKFIEYVSHGGEVTITYRGKKIARLIPFTEKKIDVVAEKDETYGLWKDHDNSVPIDEYVRNIRKGRNL